MIDYLETWPELAARQQRERIELVQSLADYTTIQKAAEVLDMDPSILRSFAWHHNIEFLTERGSNERTATRR